MNVDLLKLPWEIRVALGSGYAAYIVAYTGIRDTNKTVDVALTTLFFSLVATGVLFLASRFGPFISGGIAFVVSLAAGLAWRRFGRDALRYVLRGLNITCRMLRPRWQL